MLYALNKILKIIKINERKHLEFKPSQKYNQHKGKERSSSKAFIET